MANFKSAADLGITEPQLSALQKTLVLLETEKLVHDRGNMLRSIDREKMGSPNRFNMKLVFAESECGTVGCICGIAVTLGGEGLTTNRAPGLDALFMARGAEMEWGDITPTHAATALRSYLTTGDARWDLAVA
jgi:hypothetical protein